jgi:hypothetical protein
LLLEVADEKNAVYLCGDTAQTISRGVGFRFADVRTLFHAHCERGEAAMPALCSLAINYRTHAGIVDCAAAVVELLSKLFPTTLDRSVVVVVVVVFTKFLTRNIWPTLQASTGYGRLFSVQARGRNQRDRVGFLEVELIS